MRVIFWRAAGFFFADLAGLFALVGLQFVKAAKSCFEKSKKS